MDANPSRIEVDRKSPICPSAYVPVSRKGRATPVVYIVRVDPLLLGVGTRRPVVNMKN